MLVCVRGYIALVFLDIFRRLDRFFLLLGELFSILSLVLLSALRDSSFDMNFRLCCPLLFLHRCK
jgi:hypothetical protein